MKNFLSKFCSLRLTMLVLLLMIHLTLAANKSSVAVKETTMAAKETTMTAKETTMAAKETTMAAKETTIAAKETTMTAKETTVAAKDFAVAAKKECQTLKENLGSLLDVTVADTERLNTREFKIVIKEGGNFSSIFTSNCTVENFPDMSVEYRLKGTTDWSQVALKVIEEKQTGDMNLTEIKEGKVRVVIGEELNYCQKYEIKLKINNNDDTTSDTIPFGPLKEKFTLDQLKALDEDISAIDRIDMDFHELKDEFNATWSNICAESLRIWLKNGTNLETTPYEIRTNLTESSNNSIIISTKPCTEYHLKLESFLAPDPETKQHGKDYGGKHYFISSPQHETFGNIKMEDNTATLSWNFAEYFKHSNKSVPICLVEKTLSYKITFGLIGGEKDTLKESKSCNGNTNETLDIGKAIKDKKLKQLEKFCPYEVHMEISYETIRNEKMNRTFSKYLITNSGGKISAPTKPTLELDDSNLKVANISQSSTCLEKTYNFDCWQADKNQSSSVNKTASTDTIDVHKFFEAGSKLNCIVMIEYKTAGGNQSTVVTIKSEPLVLTVPELPSSSVGTIVGVVIFVVLLAGCVGAAVVYYRRRRSSVGLSSSTHGLSYGSQ